MHCGFLFRESEVIAGREKGFARDAADIETGPAEFLVFLDDGGAKAELRGANGSHIAAGAGANDDNVE